MDRNEYKSELLTFIWPREFCDELLGFTVRTPQSVDSGAKRSDNGDKILHQIRL